MSPAPPRRWPWALGLALLAAGCAVTSDPRPLYHPETSRTDGDRVLVVGVERDPANTQTVDDLAREFAFGLAQRGRAASHLVEFLDSVAVAGRTVPDAAQARLRGGITDPDTVAWLRAERVRHLIFLEVKIYEQVWAPGGKRTRVGLAARGRDLADGEQTWYAHTTPEVEDEAGRGFQLGTEAALGALLRVVSGEREPLLVPRLAIPYIPPVRVPW